MGLKSKNKNNIWKSEKNTLIVQISFERKEKHKKRSKKNWRKNAWNVYIERNTPNDTLYAMQYVQQKHRMCLIAKNTT